MAERMRVSKDAVEVDVKTFPTGDGTFKRDVIAGAHHLARIRFGSLPRRLEQSIRQHYPNATVRLQDEIAVSRDAPALYVYRDGSAMPPDDGGAS